jgi:hypothetical protein
MLRVVLSNSFADHSIFPGGDCDLKYMNHADGQAANARFQVWETTRGRVIRAFSTRVIRPGQEIAAKYK